MNINKCSLQSGCQNQRAEALSSALPAAAGEFHLPGSTQALQIRAEGNPAAFAGIRLILVWYQRALLFMPLLFSLFPTYKSRNNKRKLKKNTIQSVYLQIILIYGV